MNYKGTDVIYVHFNNWSHSLYPYAEPFLSWFAYPGPMPWFNECIDDSKFAPILTPNKQWFKDNHVVITYHRYQQSIDIIIGCTVQWIENIYPHFIEKYPQFIVQPDECGRFPGIYGCYVAMPYAQQNIGIHYATGVDFVSSFVNI